MSPGVAQEEANLPKFYLGHFYSFNKILNSIKYREKAKKKEKAIFLIRDLRDCVCSIVKYMDDRGILLWPNILYSIQNDLEKLHLDFYGTRGDFKFSDQKKLNESEKKVLRLYWTSLTKENKINKVITALTHFVDKNLSGLELLDSYIADDLIYLVKYENILPLEEGNDLDVLTNEIFKIAHFFEADISNENCMSIISGLWGHKKSWTFNPRTRKNGRWEIEFTDSNLSFFEIKLGTLNRALGYN